MRPATLTRRQPGGSESCRTVGEKHHTLLSRVIQAGCRRFHGLVARRARLAVVLLVCCRDTGQGRRRSPPSFSFCASTGVIDCDTRRLQAGGAWPPGGNFKFWIRSIRAPPHGCLPLWDVRRPTRDEKQKSEALLLALLSRLGAEGITVSTDEAGALSPILRFVVVFANVSL